MKLPGLGLTNPLAKVADERILRGKNHEKRKIVELAVKYLVNPNARFNGSDSGQVKADETRTSLQSEYSGKNAVEGL